MKIRRKPDHFVLVLAVSMCHSHCTGSELREIMYSHLVVKIVVHPKYQLPSVCMRCGVYIARKHSSWVTIDLP